VLEQEAIRARGRVIGTTAEHPHWVIGKGFTEVRDLQPGDVFIGHGGQRSQWCLQIGGHAGIGQGGDIDRTQFISGTIPKGSNEILAVFAEEAVTLWSVSDWSLIQKLKTEGAGVEEGELTALGWRADLSTIISSVPSLAGGSRTESSALAGTGFRAPMPDAPPAPPPPIPPLANARGSLDVMFKSGPVKLRSSAPGLWLPSARQVAPSVRP
jgi:hypothetical protein